MASELAQAIDRVHQRKMAIAPSPDAPGILHDNQSIRLQLSGLDLDIDDLVRGGSAAAAASMEAAANDEAPLPALFSGCWIDGLQTGLALAQIRSEAGD